MGRNGGQSYISRSTQNNRSQECTKHPGCIMSARIPVPLPQGCDVQARPTGIWSKPSSLGDEMYSHCTCRNTALDSAGANGSQEGPHSHGWWEGVCGLRGAGKETRSDALRVIPQTRLYERGLPESPSHTPGDPRRLRSGHLVWLPAAEAGPDSAGPQPPPERNPAESSGPGRGPVGPEAGETLR